MSTAGTEDLERTRTLSGAQLRHWFLWQLDPRSAVHNVACAVRLHGAIDGPALRAALSEIVTRHPILSSRYPAADGQPSRTSGPAPELTFAAAHGRAAEVDEIARAPFAMDGEPLLRATLLSHSANEHVLALCAHRIVCDEPSLRVVAGELASAYAAAQAGEPVALPDPVPYEEVVERGRESLHGGELRRLLDYWLGVLEERPPLLDLPADRPRPAVQTFRGAACALSLEPAVAAACDGLAGRLGVDRATVHIAALAAVIGRYTACHELAIGMTFDPRRRGLDDGEGAPVVGPLVNQLVLRVKPSPAGSFADVVAHVGEVLAAAREHGELPFELLLEQLGPERSLSHAPLFQVLVEPLSDRLPARLGTATAEPLSVDLGAVPVDLALHVGESATELRYSRELFDHARIVRMRGHYLTLLGDGLAHPDRPVGELRLLTDEEREQVVVGFNQTAMPFPAQRQAHELVEAQVELRGAATAAESGERALTYAELDRQANRLARRLQGCGVEPGALVGLCLERSLEMLVSVLAIFKAGAAYVPLDPAYPRERLRFMVEDAGVGVLVTSERLAAELELPARHVLCLDRDAASIDAESAERPALDAASDGALAYVIYTSGSTGKPKGVQVPHRGLVNLLCAFRDLLGTDHDDTLVAVTSLSFDISGLELLLPLISGGRVVIATQEEARHGTRLAALLRHTGATVMQATPAGWRLLLDAGWDGRPLRAALVGGEALAPDLARALVERVPAAWNVYGPTETTIWSSAARLKAEDLEPVPIGRPIANTQMYVLDERRIPLPVGVPGELYIGGDGVTRGYLGRPELTAERFVPDPFAAAERRIYRTGDLGRYRPDGTIDFLGRRDDQVKVRGFRIELGEIESRLVTHPEVRSAAVAAREDGAERRLVAYVIPTGAAAPAAGELRRWLARDLPDYMLPESVVELAAFPLTPNGKVDRRALPAPAPVRRATAHVAPAGRDERELAVIWQELLGLEQPPGATDNFFELGGNSLMAARLLAVVERHFHRELPLAAFFGEPTVRGLAAAIGAHGLDTSTPVINVQANGSKPPLFCFSLALGGVLALRHIAAALGPDQPIIAFLVAALPWVRSHSRVQEIAAAFAPAILERQPDGPLFLFGHSFGGLVAYELAQSFTRAGRELAPLTMIDTVSPTVWQQGGVVNRGARALTQARARLRPEPLFVPGSDEQRWSAVEPVITRYVPRPYGGEVTLWGTDDDLGQAGGDPWMGWRALLPGRCTTEWLPGDHLSILRPPHVHEFTGRFAPMLDRWQAALR